MHSYRNLNIKSISLIIFIAFVSLCCQNTYSEDFEKSFEPGWHLITLPCEPSSGSPAEALDESFTNVFGYVNGKYTPLEELQALTSGMALWVYVEQPATATISGSAVTGGTLDMSIPPGWNAIGSPFEYSVWQEAQIDGEDVGTSVKLYEYDNQAGDYVEAAVMDEWKGYFVKIEEAATVTVSLKNGGEVTPQGAISGIAQLEGLGNHTGININIDPDEAGQDSIDITTGSDGSFSRSALNTGAYTVTASFTGFDPASTSTQVFEDQTTGLGTLTLTDTTCPVISSLYPSDGLTITTSTPTISATFSDTGSGVDSTSAAILLKGNDVTTSATVSAPGFSYTPPAELADGQVSISVSISDYAGNTTTATATFTVETSTGFGQPANVTAEECEYGPHTLLCLTWDEVDEPDVTGYAVYLYHDTETFDAPYSGSRAVPVGRYTVGGLTPGETYGVEVTAVKEEGGLIVEEGAHSDRASDSTVENAGNQAVVSFRAVHDTSGGAGRVLMRTGGGLAEGFEVVASATVNLIDSNESIYATSTTDEFGWTELANLSADTYNIDATHDMGTPDAEDDIAMHETNVVLVAGQAIDLGDMTLAETGQIQGVATLSDQAGHSLIDVGIPGTSFWAKTDATGSYTIFYIPPGTWDLTAYKDDYVPVTVEDIVVESKQTTTATDIILIPDTGTITGSVTLDNKTAGNYGGVTVSVQGTTLTALTSSDGSFTITFVPPSSTHTVTFTADGYETQSVSDVTVVEGQTTNLSNVNLTLNLISLAISPLASAAAVDTSVQFHATGTYSDLSTADLTASVEWTSSDETVGAIDSSGLFTASATNTGTIYIRAEHEDGLSASTTLLVGIPPDITSITPAYGNNDEFTTVIVDGSGFVSGTAVRVGGTSLTGVSFINSTRLSGMVPAGITRGAYDVTVTNPDTLYDTLSSGFEVQLPPPSVTTVLPSVGVNTSTTTISITGSTFIDGASLSVDVGATPCAGASVLNENTITANAPPGISVGTYDVTVTNGDGKQGALADAFEVTYDTGALAGSVTLQGKTSGNYDGVTVSIQGTTLTTVTAGDGSFVIDDVPATDGYTVMLTADGYDTYSTSGISISGGATTTLGTIGLYYKLISVSVAPDGALVGTGGTQQFTATGTYSDLSTADITSAVTWTSSNTVVGDIDTAGLFTADPAQTGTTYITARDSSGLAATVTVVVGIEPAVSSIDPASGNNDEYTNVTISGSDFLDSATAKIGGASIVNVAYISSSTLTGQVPFGLSRGTYDITVTNPSGLSDTLSAAFEVQLPPPSLTTVLPSVGVNTATTTIQITGSTFIDEPLLAVYAGSATCSSVTYINENTISAGVPPGMAIGTYDVNVTNGDGKQATLTGAFTVTLDTGALAGGVTLEGKTAGNYDGVTVSIQGTTLTTVTAGDGSFVIDYVPATTGYTVLYAASGYETYSTSSIDISGGATTTLGTVALSYELISLAVSPTSAAVDLSDTQQFHATGTYSDLSTADLTNSVTWTSSNTDAGTIDAAGLFTADAAGTGTTYITAQAANGLSTTSTVTVAAAPSVSSISPTSGNNDEYTNVTINGAGFESGATARIGNYNIASIVFIDSTKLIGQGPFGLARGSYDLTVTNPSGLSDTLSSAFEVQLPAPVISTVIPGSGVNTATTSIQITGSIFVDEPLLAVHVGSATCTSVTYVNQNTISAVVPAGIAYGTYGITVTNGDGKQGTLENGFRVTIPGVVVNSISPVQGANDAATSVEIYGNYFASGASAYILKGFNSKELESLNVQSPATITASVPSGLPYGTYNIRVINVDLTSGTLTDAFTVTLPAPGMTSATPTEMINDADLVITIAGTNLVDDSEVLIGSTYAIDVNANEDGTQITCRVPAGIVPGVYDIQVTNPDAGGLSDTLSSYFTVKALSRIIVQPASFSLALGESKGLSATCEYTDGTNTIEEICTSEVTWTISNDFLGSMSTDGVFTASPANTGSLTIKASQGVVYSEDIQASVYDPRYLFQESAIYFEGMNDLFCGDIDLDGDMDVFAASSTTELSRLYLNDGNGNLTATPQDMSNEGGRTTVFGADFNMDGYIDFFQSVEDLWINNEDTTFTNKDISDGFGNDCKYYEIDGYTMVFGADLDGDGDNDLLLSSGTNPTKACLGFPDGLQYKFATNGGTFAGGPVKQAVFAADVDNDGDLDYAEGNDGANRIWINDGNAMFTDSGQMLGTENTTEVFMADFDRDGDVDLFSGNAGPNSVWMNDGSGAFSDTGQALGNSTARDLFAVDIDNNGDIDVVEARIGKDFVFLNTGDGGFMDANQEFAAHASYGLFMTDLNGDNIVDVITDEENIWFGSSDSLRPNTQPLLPQTHSATPGNHDGGGLDNDLKITWLKGYDTESSKEQLTYKIRVGTEADGNDIMSGVLSYGYGDSWASYTAYLYNLDYGTYYYNIRTVDTGHSTSSWSTTASFMLGIVLEDYALNNFGNNQTTSLFIADVDNDGDFDSIEGVGNTNDQVHKNNGGGRLVSTGESMSGNGTTSVYGGDFDNDGDVDYVAARMGVNSNDTWFNDGTGSYTSGQNLGANDSLSAFCGDIDSDGDVDLIFGNDTQGNTVYTNDGTGLFTDTGQSLGAEETTSVFLNDVDMDGDFDIIAGNSGDGNKIWTNDGSGAFTDSGQSMGTESTKQVFAADTDNDGDADIISGNTGNARIWENNGSGVFSYTGQSLVSGKVTTVFVVDINNDGDVDILTGADGTSNEDILWENDGTGDFYQSIYDIEGLGDNTGSIVCGNFNPDNTIDIVIGRSGQNNLIYRVTSQNMDNNTPTAPAVLGDSVSAPDVTLSWSAASDQETPVNGLTYNLRVGTSSGGDETLSSVIGWLPGNIGYHTSWTITGLASGTYYWSVQAVDGGYMRSAWASETTFIIP